MVIYMFNKYKSWYDLSFKEAYSLEKEFISHDMGGNANHAMHTCVVIGIVTFVLSAVLLAIMLFSESMNSYLFVVAILFMLFGMILVVASTIEYHIKFNSWLEVTKNIIKK